MDERERDGGVPAKKAFVQVSAYPYLMKSSVKFFINHLIVVTYLM